MRVEIYSLIGLMLALVSPLLGVGYIAVSLISYRKISYIALAVSLPLIYSYFPILWDSAQIFNDIHIHGWASHSPYIAAISYISWIPGASYVTATFTVAAFIVYIQSKILFEGVHLEKRSANFNFVLAILIITTFEYRTLFDIQRTSLAAVFMLLSVASNRPTLKAIFSAVAAAIHVFFLVFIAIFLISKLASLRNLSRQAILITLSSSLLASSLLSLGYLELILGHIGFIPERAIKYLQSGSSRFSSPVITYVVQILKVSTIAVIAITLHFSAELRTKSQDKVINFTMWICITSLCVSFDEILLERFYVVVAILGIYAIGFSTISPRSFIFVSTLLLANFALHGLSNALIIFAESYSVMPDQSLRIEMGLKPLYLPTFILLDHGNIGYSDDILIEHLRFRQYN